MKYMWILSSCINVSKHWCVPMEGGRTTCMCYYNYVTMRLLAVRVRLDTSAEFITVASIVKGRQ